jgi:hypothetical protein
VKPSIRKQTEEDYGIDLEIEFVDDWLARVGAVAVRLKVNGVEKQSLNPKLLLIGAVFPVPAQAIVLCNEQLNHAFERREPLLNGEVLNPLLHDLDCCAATVGFGHGQ